MAISITKRREFIHYIFEFFKTESTDILVSTYDMALTTKYPVDWEAFYKDIITTCDKKVLPMPKFFTDKISQFKKRIESETKINDGCIIRVILKSGRYLDFTVDSSISCSSLDKVKRRFKKELNKIIQYPKETTLINEDVFFNVSIPKKSKMTDEEEKKYISEKENELKQQVKILYISTDNN